MHQSSYANIRVHSNVSIATRMHRVPVHRVAMLTLEYTLARHPVHPSSYANIRVHSSKDACA